MDQKPSEALFNGHKFIAWEVREDPYCENCGKCASEIDGQPCSGKWEED